MVEINKMLLDGTITWHIDASDLHKQLMIKIPFKDWCKRIIELGFDEYQDFFTWQLTSQVGVVDYEINDISLSLEMAKYLAMSEKTEEGWWIRQKIVDFERLILNSSHAFGTKVKSKKEWESEFHKHYNQWMHKIVSQDAKVVNSFISTHNHN